MSAPLADQGQTSVTQGPRAQERGHDWVNERSLALGRAVGQKIQADPALVGLALERLGAWERVARESGDTRILPAFQEWRQLLETSSLAEVVAFLAEDSDSGTRLRQSSPFAGVLSDAERNAIFQRFEEV